MDARREQGRFQRVQTARAICAECPVQQECLEYALTHHEIFGVWGGRTERERRKLLKERERRERS